MKVCWPCRPDRNSFSDRQDYMGIPVVQFFGSERQDIYDNMEFP